MKTKSHIDSRVRYLREKYHVIAKMLSLNCNGFSWDLRAKCILCDQEVYDNWVKVIFLNKIFS